MTNLATLTVAELADGICLRAGRIAAAQAELLTWIAEFDRREGWAGPGMLSCAHWLSWRVGTALGTARDQVRVARRLEALPEVAAAFAEGRMSYSKVRAITRVADPHDGIDWVELARHSSAAQLDRLVRGVGRARADEAAERDPEAAAWRLRTRTRYDDQGNFVLTVSGPAELLPVIRAGLDAKRAQLRRERDATAPDPPVEGPPASEAVVAAASEPPPSTPAPTPAPTTAPAATADDLDAQAPGWPAGTTVREVAAAADAAATSWARHTDEQIPDDADPSPEADDPSFDSAGPVAPPAAGSAASPTAPPRSAAPSVSDADALVALAEDALDAERLQRPDTARRRKWQLTAQVDPLSGWARLSDGEMLPPSSLAAVLKTLPGRSGLLRLRPVTHADLRRHDLGRRSREVSPALRELLGTLDGERCRFPGCTRTRSLHAHHVRYWSEGGPTDLANLVLVCSRHHSLVHTQGFALALDAERRLEVRTADGTPVPHSPAQPTSDGADVAAHGGWRVSAETLPPDHTDARLQLHYAVSVLMSQAA